MKRTFEYYLKLNKTTKQPLEQTLSCCNFLYNFILGEFKNRDKNREKQPTEYQLIKSLVEIKRKYPHLKKTHSQVLQEVAKRVYKTWSDYGKGKKLGIIKGYPRFKPIHRYNSFTYPLPIKRSDCGYRLDASLITKRHENRKLKLTLGNQNSHNVHVELKIRMERNLEGDIKTLTIKRKNDRYYTLFSSDNIEAKPLPITNKQIGLDLGIKTLITTSNGEKIKNPRFYKKSEKDIKEAQQSLSSKIQKSQNWLDAKLSLAKKWEKTINQFKHHSYQTANKIVKKYDEIAMENLNVKSMLIKKLGDNKRSLRRSLLGVKFGVLLKVISDKVEETGRRLVLVNPKNTTQTCSNCNELAETKLTLRDRVFGCWNCELELDRDINSAINILNLGFDRNPPLIKENNF